jgi:hypothetical protein
MPIRPIAGIRPITGPGAISAVTPRRPTLIAIGPATLLVAAPLAAGTLGMLLDLITGRLARGHSPAAKND